MGRTATTIIWLSLVMLVALLICSRIGGALGSEMFTTACFLLGAMAGTQGGKSVLEAGSTGIGLKNAVKAMVGETKPPPPPEGGA